MQPAHRFIANRRGTQLVMFVMLLVGLERES